MGQRVERKNATIGNFDNSAKDLLHFFLLTVIASVAIEKTKRDKLISASSSSHIFVAISIEVLFPMMRAKKSTLLET